jgi:TonB family protein
MPKKVLLIEYEPRYVERVRTLLGPLEHTVTESHDGEAGLAAFGASKFDLVLLSGMLPRLPSAEVIREIRKKGGATAPPIILMMSGYRGDNRKADAQKVGAFDILARPFTDEDFLGTVNDAFALTDIGAKTMRIDMAKLASAGNPLTSSDIFSDVLDELVGEMRGTKRPTPPVPTPTAPSTPPPPPAAPLAASAPAAPSGQAPAPSKPAASSSDEVEKRLRDTLSGLNLGPKTPPVAKPPASAGSASASPPAPPAPPPRPKLSSDTDVDKILSDTLSGIARPKPRTQTGLTPPPAGTSIPTPTLHPRRREEPAAAVPSSGPDHFGQYEIIERIASGGMAELYKAKRTGVEGFQKIVAIKKILPHLADDEEFITMFADEAKLAAQLNHPNIIHIYDLGKIQAGGYFIAMEYVDGRDLRAIQKSGRELDAPLPVPLAVYIASKVASALDYAHRRRDAEGHDLHIVHRDVSPQNILISYEGDIKLCDFGIAKANSKASQTQSGALKGKLQYMSPEQAWAKPIDRRSDLFSLGVVLHELLTGDRLFRGDTDIQVLEKVRTAEVIPPSRMNPEVPKNLDGVLLRCLAKDPEERYANASDLLRDLDSVLYSYTPAPGSADVAIYLHRLQAEETAIAEARAREAAQAQAEQAQTAASGLDETARRRKSKAVPIRRTGPAPKAAEPPAPPPPPPSKPARPAPPPPPEPSTTSSPEIFASAARAEAETGKRTPLFIAIGIAAAVLAGFGIWKATKKDTAPAPVVVPTHAPAVVVATEVPAPAFVPTAAPAIDSKAVEAEVQRQLAAKRKELERAAAAAAPAIPKKQEAAPAVSAPEPTAPAPPTEAAPTPVPTARPEPSPVPTEPPQTVPPAPPAHETQRGDLVGPGAGVIEPVLVSVPRVSYPPLARERRVAGKVVVLVQVDENGRVVESRVQQGLPGQDPVNAAVLSAVRNAKFEPATKNGIPVKMWRPVVVEVKP